MSSVIGVSVVWVRDANSVRIEIDVVDNSGSVGSKLAPLLPTLLGSAKLSTLILTGST